MVFRDPLDRGEKWLMSTPAPSRIVGQLETFIRKWETVKYKTWSILSPSALSEAKNMKLHMIKGCLTGIKPGRGTNRNEALHRKLNKMVESSRYGVELAYALFTTFFCLHNEKIAAKKEDRRERIITEYTDLVTQPSSMEYFGIQWLDTPGVMPVTSEDKPLTLQRSKYSDFVSRLIGGESTLTLNNNEEMNSEDNTHHENDNDFIIPLHNWLL